MGLIGSMEASSLAPARGFTGAGAMAAGVAAVGGEAVGTAAVMAGTDTAIAAAMAVGKRLVEMPAGPLTAALSAVATAAQRADLAAAGPAAATLRHAADSAVADMPVVDSAAADMPVDSAAAAVTWVAAADTGNL